jgi:hypothetical protein
MWLCGWKYLCIIQLLPDNNFKWATFCFVFHSGAPCTNLINIWSKGMLRMYWMKYVHYTADFANIFISFSKTLAYVMVCQFSTSLKMLLNVWKLCLNLNKKVHVYGFHEKLWRNWNIVFQKWSFCCATIITIA